MNLKKKMKGSTPFSRLIRIKIVENRCRKLKKFLDVAVVLVKSR